ncbi:hybrid sensor histidine kinase/response regulator [Stutzerimonas kunmingensis]|uniref:hybrid sensor histidine kinase/response regulator n=1 Tax=Stutzerimonas kunmingensis TaxID=1211807 RepID=UPI00241E5523|nr:ATP-binding protein [Stutzerimonas kunmingensis]
MSIRARLIWLVIAVIAPALAFALFATYSVYRAQSQQIDQSMYETTRGVSLAVERELDRFGAVVTTLAASPTLVSGDLRAFHERLQQTVQPIATGVTIFDPNGVPLADTDYPFGAPLPMPPSLPGFENTPLLDVSPMFRDPLTRVHSVAIHRPVMRDGRVVYYLTMKFPVSRIEALLQAQELPERWLGAVLDQTHTIVARTRDPSRHVGEAADDNFVADLRGLATRQGKLISVTRDNQRVVSFISRGESSGWTVLIGIPREDLLASVLKPIGTAAIGILLVLAAAIGLAIALGRTITRPLTQLDQAAGALARGEVFEAPRTGMDETDRTAQVLAQASKTIHRSSQEMAERVEEAVAQAERSHRALLQGQKLEALGNLTAGISHEFNNLLQSMTVGLQLADMLSPTPRAKRAIEACQRSAQRATRLTRHLMTFSRNRTGDVEQVDLRALILGMHELLTGALPNNVVLQLDLPDRPWPAALDPVQCELAILNLAINARDAMPDGGPLSISLHDVAHGDIALPSLGTRTYLAVDVLDTGCGMSKEVQARAFEPFFTTKAIGEGTGLGLAQVYGFAHQSGGAVVIDSEVGRGTRVRLLLPRVEHRSKPAGPVEKAPERANRTTRVLLVDDDAEVREVVMSMLEELGYLVDEAQDADSALARLADDTRPPIDVLLSDIVMPGRLDGVGLAAEAQGLYPELPIILATGYTERLAAEHGLRVLAKPFTSQTLAEALIDAVNTP